MKQKIKMLPLPSWCKYEEDYDTIGDGLLGSKYQAVNIDLPSPDGWYYNRYEKKAYYKIDGKVYLDLRPDDWLWCFALADHVPLNEDQVAVIKHLLTFRKDKKYKHLLYIDWNWKTHRDVVRGAKKFWIRNKDILEE